MYFPVGWPKRLATYQEDNTALLYVATDRERNFFAVLTDTAIAIWYCKVNVSPLFFGGKRKEVNRYCSFSIVTNIITSVQY